MEGLHDAQRITSVDGKRPESRVVWCAIRRGESHGRRATVADDGGNGGCVDDERCRCADGDCRSCRATIGIGDGDSVLANLQARDVFSCASWKST